jgi:uncharacterized protein with ATP-grasp and redox domains
MRALCAVAGLRRTPKRRLRRIEKQKVIMKTYLDCIPCFVSHVLDAVRMTTDDEQVQQKVVREAMCLGCKLDFMDSPPAAAQKIHRFMRKATGVKDPYKEVKKKFNEFALAMVPELRELISSSAEPLETAVRLAIAGNIIDFGVNSAVEQSKVQETIGESLTEPLDMEALGKFREAIGQAEEILYLGDNAGEVVLDGLLIERLPQEKITFVVKGGPILNDALKEDAEMAGLTDMVEVIDNGSDAPGTILEDCSKRFVRRFERADLVIAKGQANYETLSEVQKRVFFMLRPKCTVLAEHLTREIGSLVLMYRNGQEKA